MDQKLTETFNHNSNFRLSDTMATEDVVQADPNEVGMYEIESLCMNCEDNVRSLL